jgi:hypothetical protein
MPPLAGDHSALQRTTLHRSDTDSRISLQDFWYAGIHRPGPAGACRRGAPDQAEVIRQRISRGVWPRRPTAIADNIIEDLGAKQSARLTGGAAMRQ